eukprot:1041021_1
MAASYLIFVSILSLSCSQSDTYCDTAFECANSSTITGMMAVYNDGYKSHTGSASFINTSNTIACQGAFSCADASSIVSHAAMCSASLSCSKVTSFQATSVEAAGVNAMSYTHISTTGSVECHGEQSCAYSYIAGGVSEVTAYGAYSLLNATIDSWNGPLLIDIYLYGYYAGFGATIICRSGTYCRLHCSGNACVNLNCDANCQNMNAVTVIATPIHDLWAYDSLTMDQANDAACSAQVDDLTFDNSKERKHAKDLVTNPYGGPVCCRGFESCYGDRFSLSSTETQYIVCSGKSSCSSNFGSNINGAVFCGGGASCAIMNVLTRTAYCTGYAACSASTITASNIYCSGYQSCFLASISSSNGAGLNLYLSGYQSGDSADVTCKELDECSIFCQGIEGCTGLVLKCYGNCTVYCDQDSLCPIMYNITPNPSANPSVNPSVNPTPMTVNPSVNPSTHPTLPSPTKEPIIESTISLKDTTVTVPSTNAVSGNNAFNLEPYLWIIAAMAGICLIVAILVYVMRRALTKDKEPHVQDSAVYSAEMTEDVVHLNVQSNQVVNVVASIEKPNRDTTEITEWLTNAVKLPRYVPNFVDNGYETMEFISAVSTAEDLKDIG